jgi:DNA-directed RNA polymerase specialized sigma24 family protein
MSEKLYNLKERLVARDSTLPAVFIMRYFQEMTVSEIAEVLLVETQEVELKLQTIDNVVWEIFNTFPNRSEFK